MSDTRVPFDYDTYDADRTAWRLYEGSGEEVVALYHSASASDDDDDDYNLKGVKMGSDGSYQYKTWTKEGIFLTTSPVSDNNISYMVRVTPTKPVVPALKLHVPTALRNLFYCKEKNVLSFSRDAYDTWTDAVQAAGADLFLNDKKEHLGVFSLTDHPQVRELLIARGLAEVIIE